MNTLAIGEIKRRGMGAITASLKLGPTHIITRNKPQAVILSEAEYQRLTATNPAPAEPQSALEYLLNLEPTGTRTKEEIDAWLKEERNW